VGAQNLTAEAAPAVAEAKPEDRQDAPSKAEPKKEGKAKR